jgi:multidrug efflux pump subunit AcrA (membrane-fusion protein)
MRDALSNVVTNERTLELEKEKLVDLNEQMANTKIYAPQDGTVLYWSDRWKRGEPIMEGSRVYNGQNLIKLPRTSSLKVDLSVPQAKRKQLRVGMRVYVEVEDVKLPGTLSFLSATVDTNRRGHTEKSYFKAEVSIDSSSFPDSVSEGMAVTVEMLVINLEGENQRIKVPNQCVTTRMITEDTPQTGCWVLDPDSGQHTWRPVTIEYSDENFIAVKPENDPGRGLRENELVHLSPLTEAENLNLEEAVMGKGEIDFEKIPSKPLESEEAEQAEGATDVSDKDEGTKEVAAKAEKEVSAEGSETNGEAAEENTKIEDEGKNSE